MPSKRAPLGVLLHVISSREGHCPTVGRPLVEDAWDDYLWWQTQDRKIFKRINTLIKDIERRGNKGIGKPETLKHGFEGYWSRRISDEHRLVYKNTEDEIRVAACRYHYGH
jgi:toxin YoeB